MERYRFAAESAQPVTAYQSSFRLARLLWSHAGEVRVDIAYLEPGDRVGAHRAGLPQLFCVVAGQGWVEGDDGREVEIRASEAAFWAAGERHSARTDDGLTALIVQAEALDLKALLPSA